MGIWPWFVRLMRTLFGKKTAPPRIAAPKPEPTPADVAAEACRAPAKAVFAGDIAQTLGHDLRGLMVQTKAAPDRQVLALLLRAVKNDGADLPAMPKELLKIQRLLSDTEVQLPKLAHAIQREPSIAAKFLAVTNSPFYAGRHRIVDVHQAIARLGLSTTQMLLTAIFARSRVFKVPEHQAEAERLYARALASAAICQLLARLDGANEQDAFIAGLFHDLGRIFVLTCSGQVRARDKQAPPVDAGFLAATQVALNAGLSGMIVESWGYPPDVVQAIFHHDRPVPKSGEDLLTFPEPEERLTYFVAAADRLASSLDAPESAEAEAARQLLEALDMTLTDELLQAARQAAESFIAEVGADKAA